MINTAHTIAKFLQENPDFFVEYSDIFSTLEVPHPHQSRTISLGERQILTLRERLRDFEFRLAELVRNGALNEATTTKLNLWCARMLAGQSPLRLPGEVALGLAEQFNLQEVALRVWGLDVPAEGVGAPVDGSVHDFANTLAAPYCGSSTDFTAVGWLHKKPASLAMLSLRARPDEPAFGLMVLGSNDPERFAPDMGTTFLQTVSNLASAALSRLKPPPRAKANKLPMTSQPCIPEAVAQWLKHLEQNRRYSPHTLSAYQRDLQQLVQLAKDKPLQSLANGNIRQFLARLHGQGLGPRSLARMLASWRGFYKWWAPLSGMALNPAADVRAPKAARGLPKALSVDQTQALLDAPVLLAQTDPISLRDRAIFELFYSSGLRLSELVGLDIQYTQTKEHTSGGWINLADHEVHVLGKGGKRRTVPIGAQALQALATWLAIRPQLAPSSVAMTDTVALFIGARGRRISPRVIQGQLTKLALQAGLPTHVHPHILRHSFASHVLQSAQDLRAVQEMLGHANISTTQLYTKLDFQHLAKAYDSAHPRAGRKS